MQAAMLTTTPTILPPMRHPVTVAQALMFLERHGHSPIMTPDGILVKDWQADTRRTFADFEAVNMDDIWEEVPYVFPVVGNVVDLAPIREWQGY
jgi:hypothetical protein